MNERLSCMLAIDRSILCTEDVVLVELGNSQVFQRKRRLPSWDDEPIHLNLNYCRRRTFVVYRALDQRSKLESRENCHLSGRRWPQPARFQPPTFSSSSLHHPNHLSPIHPILLISLTRSRWMKNTMWLIPPDSISSVLTLTGVYFWLARSRSLS